MLLICPGLIFMGVILLSVVGIFGYMAIVEYAQTRRYKKRMITTVQRMNRTGERDRTMSKAIPKKIYREKV